MARKDFRRSKQCSASRKLPCRRPAEALKGRDHEIRTAKEHFVNHRALKGPYPEGLEKAMFGLGCFWGAEKSFWELGDGIYVTAVGYAGGLTPNPIYEEVCSGRTGHNEVVLVVYDPKKISYETLLKTFWEGHNPTQGMRQGADVGTQYRSGIYTFTPEQKKAAEASKAMYQTGADEKGLRRHHHRNRRCAGTFYFAEDYHQQYLAKNPFGYCGHGGTGVSCPIGTGAKLTQAASGLKSLSAFASPRTRGGEAKSFPVRVY